MSFWNRSNEKKKKGNLKISISEGKAKPISQTDFSRFGSDQIIGNKYQDFTGGKAGKVNMDPAHLEILNRMSHNHREVLPDGSLGQLSKIGQYEQELYNQLIQDKGKETERINQEMQKKEKEPSIPEKVVEEQTGEKKQFSSAGDMLDQFFFGLKDPNGKRVANTILDYGLPITPAGAGIETGAKATISYTSQVGFKAPSATVTRSFVGKTPTAEVEKLFHTLKPIASRFATNSKSIALTNNFLGKLVSNPATYLATIGTYPFAGFIKEEALQTLSYAAKTATENKDAAGLNQAIQDQEEYLDPNAWNRLLQKIPYANVVNELKNFYKAARTKLEIDKVTLNRMSGRYEE